MIYIGWYKRMENWPESVLGQAFVLLGQLGEALRSVQDVTVTTDMEFRVNGKVMFQLDDCYDYRLGPSVCVKLDGGTRFPMRKDRTWNIEGIVAAIAWDVKVAEQARSDADKRWKAITAHRQMLDRVLNQMGYRSEPGKPIVRSNLTFDVDCHGVELILRLDIDDELKLRTWIDKLESIGAVEKKHG